LKIKETKSISQYVTDCKGIQYVISDIHGCIRTFRTLVEKIQLTKVDHLYLLGDYIDRGKDGKAVIDYIMELKRTGNQVFPIMGNHEETLLSINKIIVSEGEVIYSEDTDKSKLFNENYEIEKKYFDFISNLPYFIELETCYLVHAGFEFDVKNPFTAIDTMLWIRNWRYDAQKSKNKYIVYGHTPTPLEIIQKNIQNKEKKIPLDNGCVFINHKNNGYANLLCLNINDFSLIIQPNIDDNE
jgi:serine/threonine protein phosphatase 1